MHYRVYYKKLQNSPLGEILILFPFSSLRPIPLEVQAISAKIIYQKSTHGMVTFGILSKTTQFL